MKLLAIIFKEWTLLLKDKASLMILFVMPMCLVLVLTLLDSSDPATTSQINVLLINQGESPVAQGIMEGLNQIDEYQITDITQNTEMSRAQAVTAVSKGDYQALVVLPEKIPADESILVMTDPAMPSFIQKSISATVELIAQKVYMQSILQEVKMRSQVMVVDNIDSLRVHSQIAAENNQILKPNDVQQSVPAWTLFGMFLIIIPLSSVIVKERDQGILTRLYVAPVLKLTLLFARVIAFVLVNLIQLALMFSIGVFVIPLFGLPGLDVSGHLLSLTITGIAIAFAATGFGILVGTWSRSFEQAAATGPILIIIAAAVGGIMAPVYLMPESLKVFTEYSPLRWGQHAFLEILVRSTDYKQLMPDLIKLFVFFSATFVLTLVQPMLKRLFSVVFKR